MGNMQCLLSCTHGTGGNGMSHVWNQHTERTGWTQHKKKGKEGNDRKRKHPYEPWEQANDAGCNAKIISALSSGLHPTFVVRCLFGKPCFFSLFGLFSLFLHLFLSLSLFLHLSFPISLSSHIVVILFPFVSLLFSLVVFHLVTAIGLP